MTSPLSVFYVIGSLSTGGAERHLAMVSSALVTRGHSVRIFCLQRGGSLESSVSAAGVKIYGVPQTGDPAKQSGLARRVKLALAIPYLFTLLLFTRPKIVHFFLPGAYLIGGMLARAAGLSRLVMSRRSLNNYQQKHPKLAAAEQRLHNKMRAILGNSARVVDQLKSEGISFNKLGLIYNGIEINSARQKSAKIRQDVRAELKLDQSAHLITIVANLIPYKGHSDLLKALALVDNELPAAWALLIVGRNDGIGKVLSEQATKLGIRDHVHFLGLRQDVTRLLQASDIGILCSHQEGFSNALLEGMAANLPMVASDVGGNSEAVENGVTGIIVPMKSPKMLGQAIARLATNKDLATKMGVAGQRRVAKLFSLNACVDRYETLYAALMAGKTVADIPGIGLDRQLNENTIDQADKDSI